jgi:hypothetical protein
MSLRDGLPSNVKGTSGFLADNGGDNGAGKNRHIPESRSSRRPGRINLKAVAEVLAERGLDPTEAIIDILQPTDPETGEALPCRLDADVQARVLNELLQYTQPKLKSIEVKGSIGVKAFDVNDEQAKRIAEEFLKQQAAGGAA